MSTRTSVLLIVTGSILIAASCVGITMLGGFAGVRVPISTPFTAGALGAGIALVAGGLWLLRRVVVRRHRTVQNYRARPAYDAVRGNGRRAGGLVQDTTALRARLRGANAAVPSWRNGGEGAASNATTEELPAVVDDGEPLTVLILHPWAGRGRLPLGFGRPTIRLRTVAGHAALPVRTARSRIEGRLRAQAPTLESVRGDSSGWGPVAAAAAPVAGAATLRFPPVGDPRPVGAPCSSSRAHGAAPAVLTQTRAAGAQDLETLPAGSACARAGRHEINH